MKRNFLVTLSKLVFASLLLFSVVACMREEEEPAPSMDDIHEEEGLPVEIDIVTKEGFSKGITYYSMLNGFKETIQGAALFDEIAKINFKVGDYVEEGKIVMEFPKDNPQLQYDQAKANLENIEKNYNRLKNLLEAGEVAQQQFDEVELGYKVAKRNLEQIEQMLMVEAPISGTIIALPYREGDVPNPDNPLFKISQMHKMVTNINVSDKEYPLIKKGMSATATWNGQNFKGRVTDIGLAMDRNSRSFPVEITIDNPNKILKSGITADINLEIFGKDSTLVVDRKSIKTEADGQYVYLYSNGTAKKTKIETGQESGIQVEVISGLTPGDSLINCCMSMLDDGIKLKIVEN